MIFTNAVSVLLFRESNCKKKSMQDSEFDQLDSISEWNTDKKVTKSQAFLTSIIYTTTKKVIPATYSLAIFSTKIHNDWSKNSRVIVTSS